MRAILLIVAGAFAPQPASSQGTDPRACAPIQDDSVRLACYDSVLRPAATAPSAAPPQSAAAPQSATSPESGAAAPQSAASAHPAVPLQQAIAEPPQRQVRGGSRDATAPSATAAAAIPPAGAAAAEHGLGVVMVVGMREAQGRALVFTTETGDVWVQTDSQRNSRLPDLPFSAEIKEGALSSRFLVPPGGRAIRVREAK